MHGYEMYENLSVLSIWPQDRIYNFYHCLNRNMTEWPIFNQKYMDNENNLTNFKVLNPLY